MLSTSRILLLLTLLAGSSLAWWDASFPYRTQVNISNSGLALTDYQATITLNTQALVLAGKMRSDCADLRIVASNDSAMLPFWLEGGCNSTATKIWAKVPSIPAAGTITVYAYYGDQSAASASNGTNTFIAYHGYANTDFEDAEIIPYDSFVYEALGRATAGSGGDGSYWGVKDAPTMGTGDSIWIDSYNFGGSNTRIISLDNGASSSTTFSSQYMTVGTWRRLKIIKAPASAYGVIDSTYTSPTLTTNLPNTNLGLYMHYGSSWTGEQNYSFARKYASAEPTSLPVLEEETSRQFAYRQPINITNTGSALTDYQANLTINTASLIAAGKMRSDCGDIRFTNSSSYNSGDWTAAYPHWTESGCNSTATKIWAKVPLIPAAGTITVYAYYGDPSAASASSGANTFIQYHGAATSTFYDPAAIPPSSYVYEAKGRKLLATFDVAWGMANANPFWTDDATTINPYNTQNRIMQWNEGSGSPYASTADYVTNQWYKLKIVYSGSGNIRYYRDDTAIDNGGIGTNKPDENMGLILYQAGAGQVEQEYSFARKYASTEPTASFGTEQQPDTTAPSVSVQSPASAATHTTSTVPVNFTATDDTAVSSCTVRLNGTVNSSTCDNYTLTLANGAYSLNVSANDTSGNVNSSQVLFTVAIPTGQSTNTTQASTGADGVAAGTIGFTFIPTSLQVQAGGQTVSKSISVSAGANRLTVNARVTLSGQPVQNKQVTYTLSGSS